jgi:hypothetical protein
MNRFPEVYVASAAAHVIWRPGAVHVEFVDNVALGQVYLRVFGLPLPASLH